MPIVLRDEEEFVGKVYALSHPHVKELTFCFTEFPRHFLGLTNLMDYGFNVEGVPEQLYGSAEKILLKDFHGLKPRIFSVFTIYDQLGDLACEDLLNRRVLFENSQWEQHESIIVDGKRYLEWLYFLLLYSRHYSPQWKPTVVVKGLENMFSGGSLSFITIRPSLWKFRENMTNFKRIAGKLGSDLIFLPKRFFVTFKPTPRSDLRSLIDASNLIFCPSSSLKKYLKLSLKKISDLRDAVREAGNLYPEILDKLIDFTRVSGKTVVTTFVKSVREVPYEVLVVVSGGEVVFERRICQRFPSSLIFGGGEKPRRVKLDAEKYLLVSSVEEVSRQAKTISFGDRPNPTRGNVLVFEVFPREIAFPDVKAINLKLYLNGKIAGMCSSVQEFVQVKI